MIDHRADDELIRSHALRSVQAAKVVVSRFYRDEFNGLGAGVTSQWLHGELNGVAVACQARPVDNDKTLYGRINRMEDPLWWQRNLRRELCRLNEVDEHRAGALRRKTQCYVSEFAMYSKTRRATKNKTMLEGLEVANDIGEAFNLADVSDKSVSNPKLRRAELMMRCRGFEETAAFMGHEAVFLTLTCPSRFHRFDGAGKPNKNWTGDTPRDAQTYLNCVWAKIRAEWKRRKFFPYGFRVAEPHHDGCPHWHILLFAEADSVGWFVPRRFVADRDDAGAGLVGVAGQYALADSPSEKGAIAHRFTCKRIDPAKGSATGYIAKYICKNIDGLKEGGDSMGLDFDSGTQAAKAAARVKVWASTWGIRQFQQIGGPSVTVWRELRKYKEQAGKPLQLDLYKNLIEYADRAKWFEFWMAQGGPQPSRASLVKPLWVADGLGKYGEEVQRVFGAIEPHEGSELITRLHTWTIQRAGTQDAQNYDDKRQHHHQFMQLMAVQYPDAIEVGGFDSFPEFKKGAALPWSTVNNCTTENKISDKQAEIDDFERHRSKLSAGWEGKTNLESFENGNRHLH